MEKIRCALRKNKNNESAFTMIELVVSILLLSLVFAICIPAARGAAHSEKRTIEKQNDIAQSPVAVDLRNIYRDAMICYNEAGPLPMGTIYTQVDAYPCLKERNPELKDSLRFIIRKKQFEVMCVAGYDTVRETGKYTMTEPYVYIKHIKTYQMDMGCGEYDAVGRFIWTTASSVESIGSIG